MERAHHQSIAEKIGDVWSQRDVVLIACEPATAREIVLGDVWPEVGVSVEGIGQSGRKGSCREVVCNDSNNSLKVTSRITIFIVTLRRIVRDDLKKWLEKQAKD